METLSLSDRSWKSFSKESPQAEGGVAQPARPAATSKGHSKVAKGLLARARRIPAQLHTKKWIFSRESTRVDVEVPVTISGIDEDGHIFSEETRTLDVSRRGAKIASSNSQAVGTYLWIESPNLEKPVIARVVRESARRGPDSPWEICVTLPEVDGSGAWSIESPPDDWQKGSDQPSAARRLERIYARDWATKFESLSQAAPLPADVAENVEPLPQSAPDSVQPAAPPSPYQMRPGEILEFVMGQPQEATQFARSNEAALPKPDQMREGAASDIEQRLARLSTTMEALESRVTALAENFQWRIESSLQALQGKSAKQTEDFEKIAQDLSGRWSQQFQEQAQAAVATLREELKDSARAVEESKQQLASLVEMKLASLSQATRDEYGQQLAQAFQERAQAMRATAEGELQSIKRASQEAMAQLQAMEQQRDTTFQARTVAAEERLTGVSLAVEALQGRVVAMAVDLQGKHASQAEELQKIAEELGGRWSQQFQEQAQAAVEKLREEAKNSSRIVEESRQQLASLTEAKLASLGQATAGESGPELAQALREQAEAMRAAVDAEVKSIKQAAEEAIAQIQASDQKREADFLARAGAAEDRLMAVSSRADALLEDLSGKSPNEVDELKKVAQELGGRLSLQCQKQAEVAMEKLRGEMRNSSRAMEEITRQLAGLAETKRASLSQAAANAAASFEAQQRRMKNQFESSRKDLEDLVAKRMAKLAAASIHYDTPSRGRGIAVKLALVAGLFLIMVASVLGVSLSSTHPVMQLLANPPADFVDQNPTWNAKRRAHEEEVAQAYWQVAIDNLQEKYPFGSELPADPPTDFQVDSKYAPPGGPKALAETRDYYWERLRTSWAQRQCWLESQEADTTWGARLHHLWEKLRG